MKKKILALGLALSGVLLLSACAASGSGASMPAGSGNAMKAETMKSETASAYHKINAKEAKAMMEKGGVTIVDVRTPEEYQEKRIPGAINVPLQSIGQTPPKELPDKNAVLLIHCRSGIRSKQASDKLVQMGYTHIYDFGGLNDWPYETESGAKK